jgi:hypothetical protein
MWLPVIQFRIDQHHNILYLNKRSFRLINFDILTAFDVRFGFGEVLIPEHGPTLLDLKFPVG